MKKLILSLEKLNEYVYSQYNGEWDFRNAVTKKIVTSSGYWYNAHLYLDLNYVNHIETGKYFILFGHMKIVSLKKDSYKSLKLNNDFRSSYHLVLE